MRMSDTLATNITSLSHENIGECINIMSPGEIMPHFGIHPLNIPDVISMRRNNYELRTAIKIKVIQRLVQCGLNV